MCRGGIVTVEKALAAADGRVCACLPPRLRYGTPTSPSPQLCAANPASAPQIRSARRKPGQCATNAASTPHIRSVPPPAQIPGPGCRGPAPP